MIEAAAIAMTKFSGLTALAAGVMFLFASLFGWRRTRSGALRILVVFTVFLGGIVWLLVRAPDIDEQLRRIQSGTNNPFIAQPNGSGTREITI